MSKGSNRRPTDDKKFADNFDKIFGKKNDKSNAANSSKTKKRKL